MNLVRLIEYLRNHLKGVIWACIGVLVALVLADTLFVSKEHAHTQPEHYFGFWAGFGFFACVAIILGSKWFGHAGIMKREDYYETAEEEPPVPTTHNHHGHAPHH